MRRRGAALVLAIAAPAAATAQNAADWAATQGAGAQEQLEARLRAAVRKLGNTDTEYLIGGYLQLDAMAARRRQDGDEQDTVIVSATPFAAAGSERRLGIRQSQINWLSRTPTGAGDFWTRIEVNFFDGDGEAKPVVNQFYAKQGEGRLPLSIIVGKTYSTFMDENALPTTLDYNGPSGVTFARQWLLRASVPLGKAWRLEAALEESQADLAASGAPGAVSSHAERPDLTARLRAEGEWGSMQLSALSRSVTVSASAAGTSVERRIAGEGLSFSGSVGVLEDDAVLWQVVSGKGIGRYYNDPLTALGIEGAGLDLLRMSGATLYYEHQWSARWKSVAGASTLWIDDEGAARPQDALRRLNYYSANLIWRASPVLVFGGEVIYGKASRVGGDTADNTRLQLSMRYLIF
jgi:hypothetical protein